MWLSDQCLWETGMWLSDQCLWEIEADMNVHGMRTRRGLEGQGISEAIRIKRGSLYEK